jgi:hypothetical protein
MRGHDPRWVAAPQQIKKNLVGYFHNFLHFLWIHSIYLTMLIQLHSLQTVECHWEDGNHWSSGMDMEWGRHWLCRGFQLNRESAQRIYKADHSYTAK